MSTRSYIGLLKNGRVRSIYHHWDGYPEGLGKVLFEHYRDEARINALLDLGDMSSIGTEPIGIWGEGPKEYCQTYKARGEENVGARNTTEERFLEFADEDYTYLFKDGEWYVRNWDSPFEKLEDILNGGSFEED